MTMGDLISVIVPVYNVEEYLKDIIQDLKKQKFSNLEIILVDDGSTDNSPKICDQIAAEDSRFIVIHKSNEGAAAARNVALENVSGEYISFIDSDDRIPNDYYEILYNAIVRNNSDIAICHEYAWDDGTKFIGFDNIDDLDGGIINEDRKMYLEHFMEDFTGHVSWLWNKLYRRSVIDGIRIPILRTMEDLEYNAIIACKVNKVTWIEKRMYVYRIRSNGLTDAGNAKLAYDYTKAMEFECDLFETIGDEYASRYKLYALNQIADKYTQAKKLHQTDEANKVRDAFNKNYDNWRTVIPDKVPLKIIMMRYFPVLYYLLKAIK